MKAFGNKARLLLEQLAAERDATKGESRFLLGGTVKLDSVKAWDGHDAAVDGSEVEVVYRAYREPTARQIEEAASAKAAGVDLQKIVGRVVDIKRKEDGSVLFLVTNGLRGTDGRVPYRALNVNKGHVFSVAIGEPIGMSADEARTLADGLDQKELAGGSQVQPTVSAPEPAQSPVLPPPPVQPPAPVIAAIPVPDQPKSRVTPLNPAEVTPPSEITAELETEKTATAQPQPEAAAATGQEELLRVARAAKELLDAIQMLVNKTGAGT
jgi:hypothetical protein